MEELRDRVVNALREAFSTPPADISVEEMTPTKYVIHVTWEGFSEDPEPVRQNKVWSVINSHFGGDIQGLLQNLAFVITWTHDEAEAYTGPGA
jgi:hypothetical protein